MSLYLHSEFSGCSTVRLARHVRDVEVGSSNLLTPTTKFPKRSLSSSIGTFFRSIRYRSACEDRAFSSVRPIPSAGFVDFLALQARLECPAAARAAAGARPENVATGRPIKRPVGAAPAPGCRSALEPSRVGLKRGYDGYSWSTAETGTNAHDLFFYYFLARMASKTPCGRGFQLRCLQEEGEGAAGHANRACGQKSGSASLASHTPSGPYPLGKNQSLSSPPLEPRGLLLSVMRQKVGKERIQEGCAPLANPRRNCPNLASPLTGRRQRGTQRAPTSCAPRPGWRWLARLEESQLFNLSTGCKPFSEKTRPCPPP